MFPCCSLVFSLFVPRYRIGPKELEEIVIVDESGVVVGGGVAVPWLLLGSSYHERLVGPIDRPRIEDALGLELPVQNRPEGRREGPRGVPRIVQAPASSSSMKR